MASNGVPLLANKIDLAAALRRLEPYPAPKGSSPLMALEPQLDLLY